MRQIEQLDEPGRKVAGWVRSNCSVGQVKTFLNIIARLREDHKIHHLQGILCAVVADAKKQQAQSSKIRQRLSIGVKP